MKKFALPIVCAIILLAVLKQINPDMAVPGIVISAMIGLGVGAFLNGIVFKKTDSDEVEKVENK